MHPGGWIILLVALTPESTLKTNELQSKLRSITPMETKVYVILRIFVVLT